MATQSPCSFPLTLAQESPEAHLKQTWGQGGQVMEETTKLKVQAHASITAPLLPGRTPGAGPVGEVQA